MMTLSAPAASSNLTFASREWLGFEPEKNRWPVSFVLAGAIHLFVICGLKFAFITPPDYGMQGSVASMEVYMVAALPEFTEAPVVKTPQETREAKLPEMKSEMEMAQVEAEKQQRQSEDGQELKSSKGNTDEKSSVKGDGSSAVPGQSITTLFARASSETQGKDGKYRNPSPQYPALAERNGWEGVVVIKAFVTKEGKPEKVAVEKSSGHSILDRAALSSINRWRFTPGHFGNRVVSSWIKVPIRFELDKPAR